MDGWRKEEEEGGVVNRRQTAHGAGVPSTL